MCQINWEMLRPYNTEIFGIGSCCYVLALSIQDIRKRMISVRLLAIGAVVTIIWQIISNTQSLWNCLGGIILGMLFVGISRLTNEALGYGDSFFIMIQGVYLGIWNLMYVLIIAFTLTALYSIYLLIRFRFQREKALPFIPFLAAGHIIFVLLEVL